MQIVAAPINPSGLSVLLDPADISTISEVGSSDPPMLAADAPENLIASVAALAMTETMVMEGHSALIYTAAASNLGQMLNRICLTDSIDLVNIVRRPEQQSLLKELGAKYVVDTSSPSFRVDLTRSIAETGVTPSLELPATVVLMMILREITTSGCTVAI